MEKLTQLLLKYKAVILYLVFGGLTTVLNIVCYYLCYTVAGISNLVSTIAAWAIAVLFAFVTNRRYVFESKKTGTRAVLTEMLSFFGCRLATGVLDTVIMVVTVDCLQWNALLWKIISNVIVVILNYIASKLLIFKK